MNRLSTEGIRMKSTIAVVWALAVASASLFTVSQASARDVVLLPGASTNRAVVFFHGSGGEAENLVNTGVADESTIFLQRGFAVAASDGGDEGDHNWGSPASVAANLRLIAKLRRLGYTRLFLYGGSMGGLDAMQVIGQVHPEAVALVSPVCNLRGLPLMEAGVESEWGDARPAYLSPVSADPDHGLPVKLWASPEDTWVPKALNGDLCARELRRGGATVHVKLTTGEHTNTHMLKDEAVPNFFGKVARRKG